MSSNPCYSGLRRQMAEGVVRGVAYRPPETEPGLRVTGQRVTGSTLWVRVGSGHGSKPGPGFLTWILVQCCEKL